MKNLGSLDRFIRILLAIAVGVAWAMGLIGGWLAAGLAVVAVVLLVTSLTSTCPAYMPFGLSTRRKGR